MKKTYAKPEMDLSVFESEEIISGTVGNWELRPSQFGLGLLGGGTLIGGGSMEGDGGIDYTSNAEESFPG